MSLSNEYVKQAYDFAQAKHEGQLDDNGLPYFRSHVMQVYLIMSEVTTNEHILAGALLHDTIEDTDTTYQELSDKFGSLVADLVMELTQEGKKDKYGYYFPRLKSKAAIMIKFADRLSNLSRMQSWNKKRQDQYLRKSKFWKSDKPELLLRGQKNDKGVGE